MKLTLKGFENPWSKQPNRFQVLCLFKLHEDGF